MKDPCNASTRESVANWHLPTLRGEPGEGRASVVFVAASQHLLSTLAHGGC